jgi:hypothetical protein
LYHFQIPIIVCLDEPKKKKVSIIVVCLVVVERMMPAERVGGRTKNEDGARLMHLSSASQHYDEQAHY